MSEENALLKKELTALDGTSIVVGTIIGSAIFLIPSIIAQAGSPSAVFLIWIVGGLLTMCGALSLAEIGSIYPRAGGLYVYLREIYGPLPAFLYGWGLLSLIHSGSIAALALGFSVYLAHLLGLNFTGQKLIAVSCIFLLTIVNCRGIRVGKFVQNIFTIAKLGGMGAMILLLFGHALRAGSFHANIVAPPSVTSWVQAGSAMVAVLWAYEGWHVISFAAGEMRQPSVDLPRSLAIGTTVIVMVYLLANASYYAVLTPEQIRASPAVAATAIASSFGALQSTLISILILVSVVGSLNGMILTGPRVYYAMARDGVFFKIFGRVSNYRVPTFGLAVQGAWAALLSCSGTYQQLFTDVIFTAWLFYGFTVAGVIVLRRRSPTLYRPYRAPMFPWLPGAFCLAALTIGVASIAQSPMRAFLGIGFILTGIPFFLIFRRGRSSAD